MRGSEKRLRPLKPPFNSLRTESDEVTQLAIRQALLAKRGHVADTAPSVCGNVVDGPQSRFGRRVGLGVGS